MSDTATVVRRSWQWCRADNVFTELLGPLTPDDYDTKHFSDLRLVLADGQLDAHRLVLGAVCPLIRICLAQVEDDGDHPSVILLPDFTVAMLEPVLRLFYGLLTQDEVPVASVDELIKTCGSNDVADSKVKVEKKEADGECATLKKRPSSESAEIPAPKSKRSRHACPESGCSYVASTPKAIENHATTVHKVMSCSLCNERLRCDDLAGHLEEIHGKDEDDDEDDFFGDENSNSKVRSSKKGSSGVVSFAQDAATGQYPCPQSGCEVKEAGYLAIRAHYRTHQVSVCEDCGKQVMKHCIKNHQRKHQRVLSDEKPAYRCENCACGFFDSRALRVHLKVKHDKGDIEFKCDICSACFMRREVYEKHVDRCRLRDDVKTRRCIKKPIDPNSEYSKFVVPVSPDEPGKCPEPGCTYDDARFLKRHYLDKHVTKVCPHCHKTYTYNHFDRHVRTMHTKKFDFCCDAPGCTEGFYNRRLLECHREEVHNKELKYTCDQCGMMFFSQYRLGTHVTRRHNASRYFPCRHEGCDKAYTDKSSLKKHQRRYHPDGVVPVAAGQAQQQQLVQAVHQHHPDIKIEGLPILIG